MKQLFFIISSLLLLTSCEKQIDLKLDNKSGNIVIEGNITNQPGPYYVSITKSVAFTEANQYPPITDAFVMISDNNGQRDTLQYDTDGRYKTKNLVSRPGITYTLNVIAEGINYMAQSTMPQLVILDSMTQNSFTIGGDINYSILPIFKDPSVLGNRYLFITSKNGKAKKDLQTFSDNINNGAVNQRNIRVAGDDDDKVKVGDTIYVEMQCIDQNVYTYYTALTQISGNGPGGSASPANPPSNISNGALGIFSAHTMLEKNIVLK